MADFRYPHRLQNLRATIAEPIKQDDRTLPPIDALMVSNLENARYLTGFTGSNALVIVTPSEAVFVTDGRYDLQSSYEVPGFERVVLPPGTVMAEATADVLKKLGVRRVGFESSHLTYSTYEAFVKAVQPDIELSPRTDLVEKVRLVKDADEIALIRRAITLADECFAFMRTMIRSGMTEVAVAWEMEMYMRGRGAQKLSFDSIVGAGPEQRPDPWAPRRPRHRLVGPARVRALRLRLPDRRLLLGHHPHVRCRRRSYGPAARTLRHGLRGRAARSRGDPARRDRQGTSTRSPATS